MWGKYCTKPYIKLIERRHAAVNIPMITVTGNTVNHSIEMSKLI